MEIQITNGELGWLATNSMSRQAGPAPRGAESQPPGGVTQ
jgi:hypothetical protein